MSYKLLRIPKPGNNSNELLRKRQQLCGRVCVEGAVLGGAVCEFRSDLCGNFASAQQLHSSFASSLRQLCNFRWNCKYIIIRRHLSFCLKYLEDGVFSVDVMSTRCRRDADALNAKSTRSTRCRRTQLDVDALNVGNILGMSTRVDSTSKWLTDFVNNGHSRRTDILSYRLPTQEVGRDGWGTKTLSRSLSLSLSKLVFGHYRRTLPTYNESNRYIYIYSRWLGVELRRFI